MLGGRVHGWHVKHAVIHETVVAVDWRGAVDLSGYREQVAVESVVEKKSVAL